MRSSALPPSPGDIVTSLTPELRAVARHLGGPAQSTEDLAQDAALRLFARLSSDGRIADPRRYGFTVLRNLWRDQYRHSEPMSDTDPEETASGASHEASCHMAYVEAVDAIGRLAPHHGEILRLVLEGTDNYADIAQRLGIAKGTVMSRLSRARRALRAEMALGRDEPVASLFADD